MKVRRAVGIGLCSEHSLSDRFVCQSIVISSVLYGINLVLHPEGRKWIDGVFEKSADQKYGLEIFYDRTVKSKTGHHTNISPFLSKLDWSL
jgi:hypothetical protein